MTKKIRKDLEHEGREDYFMDIDRMVSEGLAGGTVNLNNENQIDETTLIEKEDPPKHHS